MRQREENAAGPSGLSPDKKRTFKFDIQTLCLVCGEKKKRQEYRRKIKQVSTLTFKDIILLKQLRPVVIDSVKL